MIRLVVIGVSLEFCKLSLKTLWLIELSSLKLLALSSWLTLQCVRATTALSKKIAGALWRLLNASKAILARRHSQKKAASISGT